jgi:hypothetical protein
VPNAEVGNEVRVFSSLFAEQRNQIEAGGATGIATPLGELGVGGAAGGAENLQRGEQEGAVSGDRQNWLPGNGSGIPELSLANAQGVFLLSMVDFDLPAVEIDLKKLTRGMFQVGAEQKGRLTLVEFC